MIFIKKLRIRFTEAAMSRQKVVLKGKKLKNSNK